MKRVPGTLQHTINQSPSYCLDIEQNMCNIELEILDTNILIIYSKIFLEQRWGSSQTNIFEGGNIFENFLKSSPNGARLWATINMPNIFYFPCGFPTWTVEFPIMGNIDRFLVTLGLYFECLNLRILQHICHM